MLQQPQRILVGFVLVETLRDVLQGIISYSKSQDKKWELQCVDLEEFQWRLKRKDLDGAIAHINPQSRKWLNRLTRSGVPVVNTLHDTSGQLASVLSDDLQIGRSGAQYFVEHGFRNFGFFGFETEWSEARALGFRQFLESRSEVTSCTEKLIPLPHNWNLESAPLQAKLKSWVAKISRPAAIMACCDRAARAVLTACDSLGITVPDEISILGVDNLVSVCERGPVPVSSVPQDYFTIGVEAARLLDRMMSGEKPSNPVAKLVPPKPVMVRRSTNVFAFEDKYVAAAMRIIHDQAGHGLGMKQLLGAVGVSRTWLDQRFRALTGRTPSEEIRRVRLQHVRDLLVETELSVQEISQRCGFGTSENLTHFFRRAQNMAPLEFRRSHRDPAFGAIRAWSPNDNSHQPPGRMDSGLATSAA